MLTATYHCLFLRARFAPLSPQPFDRDPTFALNLYYLIVGIVQVV